MEKKKGEEFMLKENFRSAAPRTVEATRLPSSELTSPRYLAGLMLFLSSRDERAMTADEAFSPCVMDGKDER